MRRVTGLSVVLICLVGLVRAHALDWAPDFTEGLARAAREGRPVLIAVNALESEPANVALRTELYPSEAWSDATREYVCFVANGETHGSAGGNGNCSQYGSRVSCATHRDVLRYFVHRFERDMDDHISPQHVILEPDGDVAFHKRYFTGVVGPRLFLDYLVRISPDLAYRSAGSARAARIEKLERASMEHLGAQARTWLREGDPLASAGVIRVLDFTTDAKRRLALFDALADAPREQSPVLGLLAEDVGSRPDENADETLALARSLLRVDRSAAVRYLARVMVRSRQRDLVDRAQKLWLQEPGGTGTREAAALPPQEQAAMAEAMILQGRLVPPGLGEAPSPEWTRRLARARTRADRTSARFPPLAEALLDGASAGELRGALLEAEADEVRSHATAVEALLTTRPEERVRTAAALALLGAGLDGQGHVPLRVWEAVQDPLGGPEARAEAVKRLGEDPGWNEEVWLEALVRKVKEGAK